MNDTYMGTGTPRTLDWASFNWFGLFFLLLGIVWLGNTMRWWTFDWSLLGPIALVFCGLLLFIRGGRK